MPPQIFPVFPLSHGLLSISLISGATTGNLPPGVLYQVKATYKYQAEDMDELQFEVGEIIDVIEYEDPEEQVKKTVTMKVSDVT